MGRTIRVTDSYKVPAVACPCPQGLGPLIVLARPCLLAYYVEVFHSSEAASGVWWPFIGKGAL